MASQITKAALTSIMILLTLILVVTYIATSSFNPLDVYSSHSLAAKIIVSLLGLSLCVRLVIFLQVGLLRIYIYATAKRPPDDVICPGCGNPLMKFAGSHGMPIMCPQPHCHTWWHNGPACYSKDLPKVIRIPTVPCPRCRAAGSSAQDFVSDLDNILQ